MPLKLRTWWLPTLAALLLLASCSKSNKQGVLIPKDALVVLHLNGQSLNAKLPWEEIKKNPLFEKMYADTSLPAFLKKVLDNPDNSGIDIKTDLMMFAKKDSLGGIIAIEGSVKDAEKFKLFNLDATGGSVNDEGGLSFISRAPAIVGWNKDKFVYVIDAPQINKKRNEDFNNFDSIAPKAPARDLLASCKAVFNIKASESLGEDEKFTSLMKQDGDMHLWVNTEELYKGAAGGMGELSMLKMDKFYEGNIMTVTGSFDNGKINLNYKTYVGKDLKAIMKQYSGGSIDKEMLKRIPSKDVAAVFALHFKPEGIKELIDLTGMEGLVNIGLITMGFSVDDFIKANKGDIMVALTNIKTKPDSIKFSGMDGKEMSIVNNRPDPEFVFAAAIGDKDAFNKLVKAGKKLSKREDTPDGPAFSMNDKYFVIGNNKENADKFLAGATNDGDYISHISGNPLGAYINLQYIMKAIPQDEMKDSSDKAIYDASLKMWDNVYMKGGDYDDGAMSYDIEANLLDKSTNSLKQLNQYLGFIGKIMEEKKKKDELTNARVEEIFPDKQVSPPPPPAVRRNK